MVLGQPSEQVGQGDGEEQPGQAMRALRVQLPMHVCRLPLPVLLVVSGRFVRL